MTKIQLIQEIVNSQSNLTLQYLALMQAKINFLNKFNEMKTELDKLSSQKGSPFNPFSDAIVDLPASLSNHDLERELKRTTKKISALLYGITEGENQ